MSFTSNTVNEVSDTAMTEQGGSNRVSTGHDLGTPSLAALRDLVTTGARVNHVVARRAGLSESELVTLEHLSRERIGPAEVARRLEVSTAAATGIVDRLVARGHVERRPHAADRRRTELVITDSGRAEAVGHLMPMFEALDRLDRSFSDEERAVVERYLRGAVAAFEEVLEG
jgi:DNA-binding MarR family transcriptional regulator